MLVYSKREFFQCFGKHWFISMMLTYLYYKPKNIHFDIMLIISISIIKQEKVYWRDPKLLNSIFISWVICFSTVESSNTVAEWSIGSEADFRRVQRHAALRRPSGEWHLSTARTIRRVCSRGTVMSSVCAAPHKERTRLLFSIITHDHPSPNSSCLRACIEGPWRDCFYSHIPNHIL